MRPVAIVTGGGRGIGAATSRTLAGRGWDVVVGYRQDADAAERLVDDLRHGGAHAAAVAVDVAEEEQVDRLFRVAEETLGRPAALVNSAGIVGPAARVDELSGERVARMMAVNVTGTILCCREAVRRMSTTHGGAGGAIVNVSSIASRLGSPAEYVDYAASKGAVDTFTLGLAKEVAGEGIRVNAVRPGIIDTDLHASGGQPDRAQRLAPAIPAGRPGTADEVAATIAWLCSAEATYVTGALIDVGGGR